MSKWSALVYGRTYEVDFRLIAMPEYFDKEARKWAENYILATTQIPEKLPVSPRWSLFTNGNYCVFATTCMVRELFTNSSLEETKDITIDFRGRPLYAFIGYVAKRNESGKFPPLPAYSDLKLEQFQSLYQKYIQQCWEVKPYQPQSRQPILTSEDENLSYRALLGSNTNASIGSSFKINSSQDYRLLFPETEREALWTAVTDSVMQSSQHSISVCLGLSSQKEAVNSRFLNATASNVVTVTRTPVPLKTVAKSIEPTQPRSTKALETPTPSTANNSSKRGSSEEHIGGVVGGIVCGVVGGFVGGTIPISGVVIAGGIPGVILGATLGAGIGWIAGELIASKTGELFESLTSSPNTDRHINQNQNQNPNSNSQSNRQTQNQNFGFQPKDNSKNQLDDTKQDSQKPDGWF